MIENAQVAADWRQTNGNHPDWSPDYTTKKLLQSGQDLAEGRIRMTHKPTDIRAYGKAGDGDDRGQLMREALAQIRDLRARLAESEQRQSARIAVVGIGCRIPKSDGPDA